MAQSDRQLREQLANRLEVARLTGDQNLALQELKGEQAEPSALDTIEQIVRIGGEIYEVTLEV